MAFSYRTVLFAVAATLSGHSAAHAATDPLTKQAVYLDQANASLPTGGGGTQVGGLQVDHVIAFAKAP